MKRKNVGEWSELYALSMLLTTSAAPEPHATLPIAKRIRHRHAIAEQSIEYKISHGSIEVSQGKQKRVVIPSTKVATLSRKLLSDIRSKLGRTFYSEAGDELAEMLQFSGAGPTIRDDLQVQWEKNLRPKWQGLSVKSLLGAKPTLLNASSATNFTFKLGGNVGAITNKMFTRSTGMKELFTKITEADVSLHFVGVENEVFHRNLLLFSGRLPETLGTLLVIAASHTEKSMINVWEKASTQNHSLARGDKGSVLDFLGAVGLGLRPAIDWAGRDVSFGGFIVVNRDGAVEVSDESRPGALGEYLFKNLKFEWGSRKKHCFGIPFVSDGEVLIKLNLQLRFMSSNARVTPTQPSPSPHASSR